MLIIYKYKVDKYKHSAEYDLINTKKDNEKIYTCIYFYKDASVANNLR